MVVPAIEVVDQAVVVVIKTVVGDLPRVGPNLASQVRVAEINPRIDHRYNRTAGGDIPRSESVHPRGRPQTPLGTQLRVIRRRREMQHGVQTRRHDDVFVFKDLDDLFGVGQRLDQIQPFPVQRLPDHRTTNIN